MRYGEFNITKKQFEATKSLLKLYNAVLHNVSNELVYLDELTYETSRKHLADLVGGLVEFEIQSDVKYFNGKINACHKSLDLLKLMDETIALVQDYPKNGRTYYEIIYQYYMTLSDFSHSDIMDFTNMSRSTYFRMHDRALKCFYVHFIAVIRKYQYDFNCQKLLDAYS